MQVSNKTTIIVALILGMALVTSSFVIAIAFLKVKSYDQTISVTGAAYQPIRSDLAVWDGYLATSSPDLETAYADIKDDLKIVAAFLKQQGFEESDYTVGTVQLSKVYNRDRVLTGYALRQKVSLELGDIDRITRLAKDASTLIEKGVEFESGQPGYLFTGLDAMKLNMIQLATENAKMRAEILARSTGREIGTPRSARVGIFQIRPLHSQEVSDYGINDVTSIDKEIVCTVHASFSIE